MSVKIFFLSLAAAFVFGCVMAFVLATMPEPGINSYGRPL